MDPAKGVVAGNSSARIQSFPNFHAKRHCVLDMSNLRNYEGQRSTRDVYQIVKWLACCVHAMLMLLADQYQVLTPRLCWKKAPWRIELGISTQVF